MNKPLHILYMHQHFSIRTGSTSVRSYEFARLLTEKGHKVTMLTGLHDWSGITPKTNKLIEEQEIDGIHVVLIKVKYSQKMSYFQRIMAFIYFISLASVAFVKVKKFDLIYATSTPLTIAIPAMVTSFFRHKPFVFEVRDVWPEVPIEMGFLTNPVLKFLALLLEKVTYKNAKHIVALSPGMKASIVRRIVSDESKVSVIPNSSDLLVERTNQELSNEFIKSRYPAVFGHRIVVYIGTFGVANRVEYCVEIAKRIIGTHPDIKFLLIGDGKEKPYVIERAKLAGVLGKNVFIEPAISRNDIPHALFASTVASCFMSSVKVLEDNSANKFFDAMGGGKPILINYGGWQADLLRETGAGFVIDPFDYDLATKQFLEKFYDDEWLKKASAASLELAKTKFNRKLLTDQLEQIFYNVHSKTI